ncbi:unnamed protein product [Prunus armeniaca]|uniref:Uncharacterized protein n=1 Tax=Prunus armeniaca TaxID=36596 RepID=A0A6J5W391_PRUAR|nr:unnamed protein product [Prunus armeniaca]
MLAALRSRSLSLYSSPSSSILQQWKLGFPVLERAFSSSANRGLLDLQEVEKVLSDVKADDVKVIPSNDLCEWADFMVLATGKSAWHVKNIAQALIYKAGSISFVFNSFEFVFGFRESEGNGRG